MAIPNQEHETVTVTPSGLASPQAEERYIYAFRHLQMLAGNPAFAEFLNQNMGLSEPASSAVLKRIGIIDASPHEKIKTTKSGLAFYSSDDLDKDPPKVATLVDGSTSMNAAVKVESPFQEAAVITVNSPFDTRIVKNRFVRHGILTTAEAEAADELQKQTGYWARIVLLATSIPSGENQSDDRFNTFMKTAYYDLVPPIKLNRGFAGFFSSRFGMGVVTDVSKYADEIHVTQSKKGETLSTDTWEIANLPGVDPTLVGRNPSGHRLTGRIL